MVSDTREHRMLIAKDDIMSLVHPGDRQLLGNLIRRAGAGEDDMCETCRIMTGSGGYVWLRMFIRVVKRTGNSMEVYICYTDMQGEMAARESLERNKELLSSAIMSVDMSVWEYDVPTKTVYVREGDPRKHGPTELVLSNVPESLIANGLIHGESIESYRDFFADFIEKKEVISGEALVRNSVNDEYWWEKNTITPVFDEFGILVKGIGTSINISERKAIEKEYELQLKSMENTEMYNVIAKSRSNLTKNKIQYVETSTQNAVNVPFDATFDEAVRRISHAAVTEEERKRFKRIFSRKSILEKYAKGVAEGQVRYRRWGSEQSMIWCETKYIATEEPGTNDCVLFMYSTDITDRMIEEQIVNRISTIEYDGLGVIDVKSGKYKLMNCNQEVDRGGFPKAGRFEENISEWIQKYVFEPDIEDCLKKFKINAIKERLSIEESCVITYFNPYSKENNSMTTKYTGSGLGLAITKRIIDSMGGRIEVESHKNVGTTVTVYIDVEVLDNESAKAELEEKTGTLPLERIKGKNILVCEDHPINAEIIKDVSEMAGCQVCVAENGAEGFSAFCEEEKYFYDAILMDIRMPVMDGWEAAKCIRGLVREDASGIPIIALTANAFEEDRQHSLDVGMNDHLAKPIDARKIYETLIHYIG